MKKKNFEVTRDESGVVGNYYNKYNSKNFIENFLIDNYFKSLLKVCKKNSINNFIDIGCGEGNWLNEFTKKGFQCIGTDHSDHVIRLAKKNLDFENLEIFKSNIYDENFSSLINEKILSTGIKNIFFLEVLEHLENPVRIINQFKKINFDKMLITVPNEPLWRILNCCRLKYLNNFGNTPGHINHFSKKKLKNLLSNNFEIIEIRLPLPFLLFLIKND